MKAMGESVNALKPKTHSSGRNRGNTNQQRLKPNRSGGESKSRCYNCNRTGHFARNSSSPARGQNCNDLVRFWACCKAKEKRPAKGTKKDNVNGVSERLLVPVNGTITHLWSDTNTGVKEKLALKSEE